MPTGCGRKGTPRSRKAVQMPHARVSMTIGHNQGESSVNYSPVTMVSVSSSSPLFSPPCYSISPPYLVSPPYSSNPYGQYFPWYSSPYNMPSITLFSPFILCFIKGNISVCIGCHNRYGKSREPPNNLCIKHQEWRQFTPQGLDTPQQKYSNVYYHCKPECVWLRCPYFDTQLLDISEVQEELEDSHKEYLKTYFNIHL